MIPLSKLAPSDANVRKTGRDAGVDELAASIAAHGLLQNLTVRPLTDADGTESGKFEVVAGGRRLAALKLLAKRKVISKNHPIPCALLGVLSGEEASLAENVFQCPMHPADQYDAFAKLHGGGMPVDDIAARFGVTPTVVKQRLKLAAVSPVLLQIYRDGEMTLEQLMAFTITDEHAVQERVWMSLSYNKSRDMIRRLLTEGQVPASDRRAQFIGTAAYEAAGGLIVRDLFDDENEGYFDDTALLDRLVLEKLEHEAGAVVAEGWKWVTVMPEFNYALTASLNRIQPEAVALSEEQQAELDALEAQLEALSVQHEGEEVAGDTEDEFRRLEARIDALRGQERYLPDDIAIAGAFVSLGFDGAVRIERGFVRPEDDPGATASPSHHKEVDTPNALNGADVQEADQGSDEDNTTPLSDRLIAEMTAYRTSALRAVLGQHPDVALIALLHALVLPTFYGSTDKTCVEVDIRHTPLEPHAPGIAESATEREIVARHNRWAKRLPKRAEELWGQLAKLDHDARLDLLAHCVAFAVNAVSLPWERRHGDVDAADTLAHAVDLDMTAYWQPTAANYFGRITKANILGAVREAVSADAAERIITMKKPQMAEAAERLVAGTNWLPPQLRTLKAVMAKETTVHEPTIAVAAE